MSLDRPKNPHEGKGFLGGDPVEVADAQREMDESIAAAQAASDEPTLQLVPNADPSAPPSYRYTYPDGSVRTNPDGSEIRVSLEEYNRLAAAAPHAAKPEGLATIRGVAEEPDARDFAEVMNEIASDPRWARHPTGPKIRAASPDDAGDRDFTDVMKEFAKDHKGDPSSPEQLDKWRGRFKREEEGSRATKVAREAPKPEKGRLTDVATTDWNALPPLLKGAKTMRQREIQANPEWEKNFLRVVERLDTERGGSIYARAVNEEVLDNKDIAFLSYARREFANRLAIGETLQKRFGGKEGLSDLELAKRRNENLRNNVEMDSDESAMKLMKEQAMVLAMKMGDEEIGEVAAAYQILDKDRKTWTYKRWEAGVQDVLKRSNVPWDQYKKVFKL